MQAQRGTTQLIHGLLKAVGAGGLMGIVLVAPNTLQAFDSLGVFEATTPRQRRNRLIAELRRQGLILETREDDQLRIQLTVKGIHRLQKMEIDELTITKPKTWDQRWRMVVFDIPKDYKNQRYIFVSQLRRLGFTMVRQSTWYHPYPCFEIIDEIVRYAGLSQFVTVAEIVRLDESSSRKLLRAFPELSKR